MTESITLDELLAAQESSASEGGITVSEIAAANSITIGRARELVRGAIHKGLLSPARKQIVDMSGRATWVASYVRAQQKRAA